MFRIYVLAIASFVVVGVALGGAVVKAATAQGWDYDPTLVTTTVPQEGGGSLADQFFHVEWTATASRPGQSRITGYVYNDYGQPAVNVRLQISGLDATGRDVDNMTWPVGDTVPGNGRAYFDVRVPDSRSYRVSVVSFDFLEFPGK